MGDFPILQAGRFERAVGADTYDLIVAPSATANTKGLWVEFVASTGFPTRYLTVEMGRGETNNQFLTDVGIGGAGSEVVLVANLMVETGANGRERTFLYQLPVWIPPSTRVSLRSQVNETSSGGDRFAVTLSSGGFPGPQAFSRVTTYGAITADSGGTQVDPGGSADTKGAWAQLVASSNLVRWVTIAVGNQANATPTSAKWMIDIGIGSATSEVVLIPDLNLYWASAQGNFTPSVWSFPVSIPSGTRISARAQCDITDATDRLFDIVVYGVE